MKYASGEFGKYVSCLVPLPRSSGSHSHFRDRRLFTYTLLINEKLFNTEQHSA